MATNVQRWSAFGEALLNRPATTPQLTKLGEALAAQDRSPNKPNYASLSNDAKAAYCLDLVLDLCKSWMKQADIDNAAKAAAANTGGIDTDFAKTP